MNMIIKKEAATLERTSANEGVQLQSLTLSEGTIRFEPDVTDYNVTVAEDVTKILVKGVTSDENSFYTVSGNTNLVKGKNEIVVTVTDKDGNIGHYYIHVQVGEQKEQTSQSDSQSQTNQAAKVLLSQWLSRVMKMSFFQTPLMSLRLLQKLLPQEIFNMSPMACLDAVHWHLFCGLQSLLEGQRQNGATKRKEMSAWLAEKNRKSSGSLLRRSRIFS